MYFIRLLENNIYKKCIRKGILQIKTKKGFIKLEYEFVKLMAYDTFRNFCILKFPILLEHNDTSNSWQILLILAQYLNSKHLRNHIKSERF